MDHVLIAGAGPAGTSAAIAARMRGAPAVVLERTKGPRHKVCGEFLSPGVARLLERLGVLESFAALAPRRITRCVLHLGPHVKRWNLDEPAWGLSRLRLDGLLVDRAESLGAEIVRGQAFDGHTESCRIVLATGRGRAGIEGPTGERLFGFKAHFEGPPADAVELFFNRDGYLGVNGIEENLTNVCGISPERVLRKYDFDFDVVATLAPGAAERLRPLRRRMAWLATGPLTFASAHASSPGVYPAGDALGFVDPFTGSGIMNAMLTGMMAGAAAADNMPVSRYLANCESLLNRPFRTASLLRSLLNYPELHWAAHCIPGSALFRLTRARVA